MSKEFQKQFAFQIRLLELLGVKNLPPEFKSPISGAAGTGKTISGRSLLKEVVLFPFWGFAAMIEELCLWGVGAVGLNQMFDGNWKAGSLFLLVFFPIILIAKLNFTGLICMAMLLSLGLAYWKGFFNQNFRSLESAFQLGIWFLLILVGLLLIVKLPKLLKKLRPQPRYLLGQPPSREK